MPALATTQVPVGPVTRRDRTVIVTGGTRRLGWHICHALAAQGYDIVATYSEPGQTARTSSDEVARRLEQSHGVRCRAFHLDFSARLGTDFDDLFALAPSPLSGLVNNAGIFEWDSPGNIDPDRMQRIFRINLFAPMLLTSAFTTRLTMQQADGIVVFMLDQKLYNPYPDHLSYTLAKGAAKTFLDICAGERTGALKYYGLAPGLTIPAPGQAQDDFLDAQKSVPLGISPSVGEIERGMVYLFSGAMQSGQVLLIDGGASLTRRQRDFEFQTEPAPG